MNIINIRVTNAIGGSERYIMYLFSHLKENNSLSIIHVTNNKIFKSELERLKFNVEIIDEAIGEIGTKKEIYNLIKNIRKYVVAYVNILKLAKKHNTDVIILHSMTEKLLLSPFIKLFRIKLIWFEHGPLYVTSRSRVIKLLYKFVSKYTDLILAVSKDTANDLKQGGINNKKIRINYIGMNLKQFFSDPIEKMRMKRKLGFSENDFCIGFIGNINKEKGIERFMEVSETLIAKSSNFKFIIVGSGYLIPKIKERAKVNIKHFRFTGYKSSVNSYINSLDFLLMPTNHYEGISLAILESMAMNVCVITNNIGGNKELIQNYVNGIKYNKFSSKEISKIIMELVNDQKRLLSIQNEARKRVGKSFDIENASKTFLNYLQFVYEK